MQAFEARQLQWGALGVTPGGVGMVVRIGQADVPLLVWDAEAGQGDAAMGSNRRARGLVIGVCVCG
jgi:hypothetical protein